MKLQEQRQEERLAVPSGSKISPVPPPEEIRRGRKRLGGTQREARATWAALGFLLPNLIGFLAFTLFPVVFSLWMAFTNWSLKPAVPFQFVGLRNFSDLLGARPLTHADPALLWGYVACALGIFAGLIGALWAGMGQWRGTRIGGAVLAAAGAALCVTGLRLSEQGIGFVGLIAVVCGLGFAFQQGAWSIGRGVVPALLVALGGLGICLLQGGIEHAYEPRDPYFWQYLSNTMILMLGIPFSIAGSLTLALLLHEELPTGPARQRVIGAVICVLVGLFMAGILWRLGNPNLGLLCGLLWALAALGIGFNVVVFRTLFYLPTFTAGVAMMILWQALYNPKTGPIDVGLAALFQALGIHAVPPQWLGDVDWAKPALIVMGVWTSIGGMNMLLYLAGLSNLPKELLDAAEVDGAGPWARFRHVIWPQLAPTTFFISIMAIIGGLQGGFEQARVMTNGGPAGSTTTLSYYIYNKAFQDLDMGYAAAISWVLFAIVFLATALNWKFGKGLEVE